MTRYDVEKDELVEYKVRVPAGAPPYENRTLCNWRRWQQARADFNRRRA